jgi:hypothetical protein
MPPFPLGQTRIAEARQYDVAIKNKTDMMRSQQPFNCSVIGPTSVQGMTACPCCNRHKDEGRQTLGEKPVSSSIYDSLFRDDESDADSSEDLDEQGKMVPGILSEGVAYTITKVLVQGWVHKKGTGMDWIGSRAWKPRWTALVVSANMKPLETTIFLFFGHDLIVHFLPAVGESSRL